jgi:cell division protein FtsL
VIVDGVRRRRKMGAGVACLVLVGVTLAALAHVAVQAQQMDVAVALGQEQALQRKLEAEQRRLKSEIGELKAPQRISTRAREELHMQAVDPNDIRVVRPERKRR